MSTHDTDESAVLDRLKGTLDGVTMGAPVEPIIAAGRKRRHRHRLVAVGTAMLAVTGAAFGITTYANPPAAPPAVAGDISDDGLRIRSVAYTVEKKTDGTVEVTWDKHQYINDREGLQAALNEAGFPVLIKVGEFCVGPNDDPTLDPSGTGPGVDSVVRRESDVDGKVTFVFMPAAMPAGKQLFIGYLSPAQLAVTHGAPGSVERLISTGVPLTCTTDAPPPNERSQANSGGDKEPTREKKPG